MREIRFLSGPPGKPADPNGYWSIVGFIGSDVIIAKDETIVRAPLSAVSKMASFERDVTKLENKHGEARPKRSKRAQGPERSEEKQKPGR